FEVATLVQTRKIGPFPLILVGSHFWNPLLDWIREQMVAQGYVDQRDPLHFRVVDTADAALKLVKQAAAKAGIKGRPKLKQSAR
ncbi:MAG: LOG family protein, partial [bacterium]